MISSRGHFFVSYMDGFVSVCVFYRLTLHVIDTKRELSKKIIRQEEKIKF